MSWHPAARIVREDRIGLTRARLAGIAASQGQYLVFVDDDNVLRSDYLQQVVTIFQAHPQLGAIGGKSLPEFEVEPEPWVHQFHVCLALRDFGDEIQIYSHPTNSQPTKHHPSFAPIGAGMALQRDAAEMYTKCVLTDENRLAFDRTGRSLQSGGDCDITLTLLDAGWGVGYIPDLQLTHLIPTSRTTKDYLARISYATSRSWVHVLDVHGIRPWKKISQWSVFPRKIKAFVSYQPWKSPAAYIQWQAACGMFEGLSTLPGTGQ